MATLKIYFFLISLILVSNTFGQNTEVDQWSQWRGPMGTGVALKGNPPVEFSETKNLKWKTSIPGKGHATPIVWKNNIIVQTAVSTTELGDTTLKSAPSRMPGATTNFVHEFKVLLVDRETGKIKWAKTVNKEMPVEGTHNLGSWASNSPCTDGEFIYAYFGSRGLFCLDFEGNIIWERDFGQMEKHMNFGEGASPYLYGNKIFVQWDHEGDSFLFAIDKKSGKDLWKLERNERTSWATPFVVEVNGRIQVITSATTNVRANDFETGELIWQSTGLTRNVIPNPVYADGILYVMSGFRGSALQAIDLANAKGDITGTDAILWTIEENTPYTPNPVLLNGNLYFLRVNNGYLTCVDALTGETNYDNVKLEGINSIFSSPGGVADRLYIVADKICLVIKAGKKFEVLSSNSLDDNFHSSPVIVGNELILRGFNSLYCFSE
jgi:outer membrane protein assembly factor BamB